MEPFFQNSLVTIYCDWAENVLPEIEKVDLLLTDPPYGLGESSDKVKKREVKKKDKKDIRSPSHPQRDYGSFNWDQKVDENLVLSFMEKSYLWCIWGGNYYSIGPCFGPLIWDKKTGNNDFADCELGWNNYGQAARIRRHLWNGMMRKGKENRYHPTQKPVSVMMWAIEKADKALGREVSIVLDPFAGSGSIGVAAVEMGRKTILVERSEEYCEICRKRIKRSMRTIMAKQKEKE